MMRMRHCGTCGAYTLSESHCGSMAESAHPAKFNPNDPHGGQRRRARGAWKGLYSFQRQSK